MVQKNYQHIHSVSQEVSHQVTWSVSQEGSYSLTCGLRGPDYLDHLTVREPEVPGHRVLDLDARELRGLQVVPLQQLLFLLASQNHVAGHQLVLSDVHLIVIHSDDSDSDSK
jgi:hypothetical protein